MKQLLLVIAMAFIFTGCNSETLTGYGCFYKEYKEYSSTITFKVPGALAGFLLKDEDEDLDEFVKKMDNISFLIADEATPKMKHDLKRQMPSASYKELMVIRDGDSKVVFFANEKEGKISEIIMTVIDDESLVVMCLTGEFTHDDAKRIAKSINIEQAKNYKN